MLIGTCNSRYAGLDTGTHRWGLRRARLGNLLRHLDADIWCLQETSANMWKYLSTYLPDFDVHRASSIGKLVAWNRKYFTATDKRVLALPPTVAVPFVQLNGNFWVASIHNTVHNTPLNAAQQATLGAHLNRWTQPVILAGDWNDPTPTVKGFTNAKDLIDSPDEIYATSHGWGKTKTNGRWIDNILITPQFDVLTMQVTQTSFLWESDHNVLTANIV